MWDLNSHFPKFQKDFKMRRAKVSGSKIGTVWSENASFWLEYQVHPKWLLWSRSPHCRRSVNKVWSINLVTCPNMGNYFAFFQWKSILHASWKFSILKIIILKPYNENRLAWTIAPYSFYPDLCNSPVENCHDKKFQMYLNRFDDDQRGFGSFADWLFICESDIELVKFGFQNVRH